MLRLHGSFSSGNSWQAERAAEGKKIKSDVGLNSYLADIKRSTTADAHEPDTVGK